MPPSISRRDRVVVLSCEGPGEVCQDRTAGDDTKPLVGVPASVCQEPTPGHPVLVTSSNMRAGPSHHTPGEARGVTCNIAWTPVLQFSKYGADITVQQVSKFMRTQFYKDGKPHAPLLWPRNLSIPIALFSNTDEPKKGRMTRIGLDLVVCAFYLAWADAKSQGLDDTAKAYRSIHALVCR